MYGYQTLNVFTVEVGQAAGQRRLADPRLAKQQDAAAGSEYRFCPGQLAGAADKRPHTGHARTLSPLPGIRRRYVHLRTTY